MIQRPGLGRRATCAAALGLALPVLAGCGLEAKDFTSHEHGQVQAANFRMGGVQIRDAFITTPLVSLPAVSGSSTKAAPPGPNAYLVVALVNDGPTTDQLTGVSTTIGVATISGGSLSLPHGIVVSASDPDIDPSAATIAISGKAPTVGTTVPVQFSFAEAGVTRTVQVPVVSPDGLSLSPTQSIPTEQATPPVETAPSASD